MARSRNIKPGLYKNEDLAECSIFARYIFPGLWMLADREGRIEDRPKRIKGELLAYDNVDVEPLLIELSKFGFILRYEVDGQKYIQILKFSEHQAPHVREQASTIPAPANPAQEQVKEVAKHNLGNDMPSPRSPDSLIPSSLIPSSLIPSSLIPDSREDQAKKKLSPTFVLKTYIETCKAEQTKAIPDDAEVFTYVDKIALPRDFLNLQWSFFKERYFDSTKRYTARGWPKVFSDSVKGNWFKLWFFDEVNQIYKTTTQGAQAKKAFGDGNAQQ